MWTGRVVRVAWEIGQRLVRWRFIGFRIPYAPRFFEHPPNPLTFPNTIGYNIRRWGVAIYGERWRFVPDYEPNHTRAWLGTRDVARQTTPKVALWFSLRRALQGALSLSTPRVRGFLLRSS